MKDYRKVLGWSFEWREEHSQYQCRGEVMYDNEHDEMPEPSLLQAAYDLAEELKSEGIDAQATWSEKGWVEVIVTEKNKKA